MLYRRDAEVAALAAVVAGERAGRLPAPQARALLAAFGAADAGA